MTGRGAILDDDKVQNVSLAMWRSINQVELRFVTVYLRSRNKNEDGLLTKTLKFSRTMVEVGIEGRRGLYTEKM